MSGRLERGRFYGDDPGEIPGRQMRIETWPNGLGWDIDGHEVWKLADGTWGIRTFDNGEPTKSMRVIPQLALFAGEDLASAVLACLRDGQPID